MLLIVVSAFVAIAVTTGQFTTTQNEETSTPSATATAPATATVEATATSEATSESTAESDIEITFVFCNQPDDGTVLTAETCTPLAIRRDSKVYVQVAKGAPTTIDGFPDINTGFKMKMDRGDTVVALSIENPYFTTITFGQATLKLEQVTESRTVYLPLGT